MFGSGSLTRVQYPKCAYDPYRKFNPIKNDVYILAGHDVQDLTWPRRHRAIDIFNSGRQQEQEVP